MQSCCARRWQCLVLRCQPPFRELYGSVRRRRTYAQARIRGRIQNKRMAKHVPPLKAEVHGPAAHPPPESRTFSRDETAVHQRDNATAHPPRSLESELQVREPEISDGSVVYPSRPLAVSFEQHTSTPPKIISWGFTRKLASPNPDSEEPEAARETTTRREEPDRSTPPDSESEVRSAYFRHLLDLTPAK